MRTNTTCVCRCRFVCIVQKLALEAAKAGEFVRPSERRRQHMLETQGSGSSIPGLVGGGTGDPYR